MTGFGSNPTTGTQGALATNQFPISTVAEPGRANGDLTALEGGPGSVDSNNNRTAPAAVYIKAGTNVIGHVVVDSAGSVTVTSLPSLPAGSNVIGHVVVDSGSISISSALPAGTNTIGGIKLIDSAGTNVAGVDSSHNVLVNVNAALPAGANVIGHVIVDSASSVSVTSLPSIPAGSAVIGHIIVDSGSVIDQHSNITIDYDTGAGTQTMTLYGLALPASGGAVAGGTSTNPLRTDPTGTTTQPVSGTVTVAQSTGTNLHAVLDSGSTTAVTQATGSNLHTVVDSGAITATTNADTTIGGTTAPAKELLIAGKTNDGTPQYQPLPEGTGGRSVIVEGVAGGTAVPVSGTFWQATQPVSGTVTTQQSNITADYDSGAGTQTTTMFGVALPASGGAVAGGTSTNPLRTDPTGTTTQPISATSLPLPTGAALEAGNLATLAGTVTSSKLQSNTAQINGVTPLMGNGASGTGAQRVTIASDSTGQITANAGTNLNTSALALDTSINGVIVSQGSTTSGEKGPLIQGAVTTAAPSYTTAQTSPISLTVAGAVRTDASATTQPISAASLPLPSGAATSAKQPALGTAGSASADVLSVQGIASMTALKVDGSAVTQPVSGTVTVQQSTASNLKVDLSGTAANSTALKVDGSAVTQPVSGTVTNQQSNVTADYDTGAGTQTMTMFGVALPASGGSVAGGTSTNPLRTDPTGTTTQPVSAASLPLPSGASTSAKQPALGTAGSASADVLSVQGIASMTALKVDGSAVTQPVSATNLQTNVNQIAGSSVATAATGIAKVGVTDGSGNAITSTSNALDINIKSGGGSGFSVTDEAAWTAGTSALVPAGGVFNDSAAALTSGQEGTVRVTNNRAMHANLRDASGNQLIGSKTSANSVPVVVASDQGAVPVSGTVSITSNSAVNVAQVAGTTTDTNSGNKSAGTQRVVLATDQPQLTNALKVDGSAVTQPVSGTVSITANSAVNVAQVNGVTTTTGNGVSGTGVQRVTLASDSTGQVTLAAGANTVGAVTQASGPWTSNVTQFGGTNVSTGTGASGTGIPRVTVANDSQVQLWDGTTGPIAAKAATTSPTLADKALVQVLSPNNTGLPVNAPKIVQSTSNKSSGSVASLAKAFASNNVAGNSIIVVCAVGNGTAPTISDSANTYMQAVQVANGSAFNVAIFYAVNIAAGANTVTVNNGGTTASIAMEIYEVSGLLSLAPSQLDQTASGSGSSGTASTSNVSALSPNEYAFAGVGIGTAAQTITAGSGWTNDSGQQNPTTPAGLFSFVSMSQYLGSLKAVTPQATFTSEPWAIAVATFRPVILGVEGTSKITDGTVTMSFGQNTMANSLPVAIASDQGTLTVAGSGNFTVAQATGSNLHAVLDAGSAVIGHVINDASSAVIGHVIADSGSTTAVTQATASNLNAQVVGAAASGASNSGNPVKAGGVFNTTQPTVTNGQAVDAQMTARGALIVASGTDAINVTAAAGTNLNTSALALETGGNLATLAGAVTSAKVQENVAQINGVTPLMGNGVTGTGSQRVTIASDNTAFSVNAVQSGTWTVQPGNTANTTAWKVDGSAVTQPVSATNLQTNVNQIAGSSISTAATGVQKVGMVGNAGATVDSTVGAGSAPTNAVVIGSVYNSSAPAPTNGQAMAVQADQAGNTRVFPAVALATLSAWNSGTSLNATQTVFTNSGAEAVLVQLTQTTTLTAGAITFEVNYDGSTWVTIPANCVLDPTSTTFAQISIPYTVQASTNKQFLLNMNGAQGLRIKLSTQITGSGSVTPNYALLPFSPADGVIAYSPTAANFLVTASAGTNLNTSALALETGGNLATLAGAITSAKMQANVAQINGVTPLMGNGTTGTGSQRVTIASDNTAFTVNAAQSGTWTTVPNAATSGGSTPSHTISASGTNATSLKGSAGQVWGFCISNSNASARFFKLYDKSSSPTVGTDTPKMTVQLPGSGTVIRAFPVGLVFSSGIAWALTTGIADSDTGSVGTDISVDIDYK